MENKTEQQSNSENLSFIEKHGLWIIMVALIGGLIALKIIIDFF